MDTFSWMSWEGGVDLVALAPGASQPTIIVHVARLVHTPVGSAPSGMILLQTDPQAQPEVMGFVSADPVVGRYFGPRIFAGTPFENAPVLDASIEIAVADDAVSAIVQVAGRRLVSTLSGLGALESIIREPAAMPPFRQMVVEAPAARAELTIDGEPVAIVLPPFGITGGPPAVWSPTGIYCR